MTDSQAERIEKWRKPTRAHAMIEEGPAKRLVEAIMGFCEEQGLLPEKVYASRRVHDLGSHVAAQWFPSVQFLPDDEFPDDAVHLTQGHPGDIS